MKVLIGIDPHKASLAVAVVDEAVGELLERASFPQNRAGLRALQRFKRNSTPSVVGRWRTPAALRSALGGEVGSGRRIRGGRPAQAFGASEGAL
jgi:hypothetical protein